MNIIYIFKILESKFLLYTVHAVVKFRLIMFFVLIFRIERLWRDVYGNVLDMFHTLFLNLELEGFLNPDNELELFGLHWIYVPQLLQHLQAFKDAWNHHSLRTERGQSPMQLWLSQPREGNAADPIQV